MIPNTRKKIKAAEEEANRKAILEEADRESTLEDLKVNINTFLWCKLPRGTSLGKAEDIAVNIYEIIFAEWENLNK